MSEIQDAAIIRIRQVRHRISEQHGHDPQRLVDYYLELQQQFTKRLLQNNHIEESETHSPVVSAMHPVKSLS